MFNLKQAINSFVDGIELQFRLIYKSKMKSCNLLERRVATSYQQISF